MILNMIGPPFGMKVFTTAYGILYTLLLSTLTVLEHPSLTHKSLYSMLHFMLAWSVQVITIATTSGGSSF